MQHDRQAFARYGSRGTHPALGERFRSLHQERHLQGQKVFGCVVDSAGLRGAGLRLECAHLFDLQVCGHAEEHLPVHVACRHVDVAQILVSPHHRPQQPALVEHGGAVLLEQAVVDRDAQGGARTGEIACAMDDLSQGSGQRLHRGVLACRGDPLADIQQRSPGLGLISGRAQCGQN
jgi:hypothetical protein